MVYYEECRCHEMTEDDMHPCPYAQDIEDDNESLCNCCNSCTEDCALDI